MRPQEASSEGVEAEIDAIHAELAKLWARVEGLERRAGSKGKAEPPPRSSSSKGRRPPDEDEDDPYREEFPSYTSFSLHPTAWRVILQNWKPSAWVIVVFIVAATTIAVAWLLRPPAPGPTLSIPKGVHFDP
jgi:hypothetical protein